MKTNLTYKTLMILISSLFLPSAYSSAAGYEEGYVHVGATVTFHAPVVSYAFRIRHFYHPATVINYFYDPVFTDAYWYPYDAYYWDDPFYMGSSFYVGYTGYVGFSFGVSRSYPRYYRSRYAWRAPVYHSWRYRPVVYYNYRVPYYYSSFHFSNRYYYGNYYIRNTYYNNYYYQDGYRSNNHISNHVNNRTNYSRGNSHTQVENRGRSQVQGQVSRRSYGVRNSVNSRRVASGNFSQGTVSRYSSSAAVRAESARQVRTVQTNTRGNGRTVTLDTHRRNTVQRSSGISTRTATTRSNYNANGRSRTQAAHTTAVRSRTKTGYRIPQTTVKRVNVNKPAVRHSSGHITTKTHSSRSAGTTRRSVEKNISRGHRR